MSIELVMPSNHLILSSVVFPFPIVILYSACCFFNTQPYDSKLDGHIPQRRVFLPVVGKPYAYAESHIQCFTVIFNWEKILLL